MKKLYPCILLLASILLNTSVRSQVNQSDSLALVDLYNSTNGANWHNNKNWLTSAPVSRWHGVTLSANRVSGLTLTENNLQGSIPVSFGNLINLEWLYLDDNKLSGNIPSSFGNLINLNTAYLGSNQLTGNIPSSLGKLTNLQTFELDFNKLTGAIPYSFSRLRKLIYVSANFNQLSGNISMLTKLDSLQYLSLSHNRFSGHIPVFNSIVLSQLDLSVNQFSGSIPQFKNCVLLNDIEFDYNSLTGSIQHQFDSLSNPDLHIYIDNNQLSGSLPSFNKFTHLIALGLSFNNFSGAIPALDSLKNIIALYLSNNQLSGNIPTSLEKDTTLTVVDLSNNNLSGTIPSLETLIHLYWLHLQSNKFTFNGMEDLVSHFPDAVYSPQANININQNGNVLSVTAGGTISNNTYSWYKDGVLFRTRVGVAKLTVNKNGNYSVAVTNSIATQLTLYSDIVAVTPLLQNSIASTQATDNTLSVYPNPTKTNTTVSFNATGYSTIKLTDAKGNILLSKTINANGKSTVQLDLSKYPSGAYYVSVIIDAQPMQTVKLIKQ